MASLATTFGSGVMTNSIDEIGGAKTIIAIGTNTAENHPIIFHQVKKAVANGAKLIVIDPRAVNACSLAHLHLRLFPGTDVAMLMGMARVIVDEGLENRDFIASRCENFDAFLASLAAYDLATVEKITGVPAADIAAAARIFATEGPGSILYAMGITQHSKGSDNVFAIANLAMLTGNVGKPNSGVNPLRGQNNVQGACDMGALPTYLTGYQKVAEPAVRQRFEEAWGCRLPETPGLTLSTMFDAIDRGELKAMYIMGENPILSDPDAQHVEKSLKKLELLVVQDIFLTETARLAHVVLPAACSFEKDGVFTNTERRVQRIRQAVTPAGSSRPDWRIIRDLARRMGSPGFYFDGPAKVMDEIARITPQYGGINYQRLTTTGLQWPCPTPDHPGTGYMHANGFVRGKGQFIGLNYRPSAEETDTQYPFVLTTGRNLYHYHTGSMTRRCEVLSGIQNEEFMEMNPADAARLGISDGDEVLVSSRRGEVLTKTKVTDRSPAGVIFMTFHFAESPTNQLTNTALDPLAGIPELKVCAVNVKKM